MPRPIDPNSGRQIRLAQRARYVSGEETRPPRRSAEWGDGAMSAEGLVRFAGMQEGSDPQEARELLEKWGWSVRLVAFGRYRIDAPRAIL